MILLKKKFKPEKLIIIILLISILLQMFGFEALANEDEEDPPLITISFISDPRGVLTGQAVFVVPYGSPFHEAITMPTVTPNQGYSFVGWGGSFPFIITEDMSFMALYEGTAVPDSPQTPQPETPTIDTEPPKVEYAYILNGYLFMSIKEDGGFGVNPYEALLNGEEFDGFKGTGTKLPYPSTLHVKIKDAAGNTTVVDYSIKMADQVLGGKVPSGIEETIKKNQASKIEKYNGFDNVVKAEFGKMINVYDLFRDYIVLEFGKYNEKDITITALNLHLDEKYNHIIDGEGVLEFQVRHSFYSSDTIPLYVYVDNGGVKHTNIKSTIVRNPGLISGESVKLTDFFEFELLKEGYRPVLSYFMVKDMNTGRAISLDTTIEIEVGESYHYKILDILSDTSYEIEFSKSEPIVVKNASYKDVPGMHWAFYSIKNLTLSEFLNGYPDGSFKPENNMTVREFSTMLSRYLSKLDKDKLGEVTSYYNINNSTWGNVETKAILSTISRSRMMGFNYSNVDRPITREEVALLVASNVKLKYESLSNPLKDTNTSKYSTEVTALTSSGIITGYPDKTFRPTNFITRAEVATIFDRLIEQEKKE